MCIVEGFVVSHAGLGHLRRTTVGVLIDSACLCRLSVCGPHLGGVLVDLKRANKKEDT